jgi:type IV secretory pathway ATPase VirB11/archaellum biosynthesis ATPase
MTAIHAQTPHGGWRRVSHRPRRTSRLFEKALAAIRDWRRHRRDRLQIAALDARISRDIEICRSDPLDRDREQKERDAWFHTLDFPPF